MSIEGFSEGPIADATLEDGVHRVSNGPTTWGPPTLTLTIVGDSATGVSVVGVGQGVHDRVLDRADGESISEEERRERERVAAPARRAEREPRGLRFRVARRACLDHIIQQLALPNARRVSPRTSRPICVKATSTSSRRGSPRGSTSCSSSTSTMNLPPAQSRCPTSIAEIRGHREARRGGDHLRAPGFVGRTRAPWARPTTGPDPPS